MEVDKMVYKIRVIQIDFEGKVANKIKLEQEINEALVNIDGEVTSIANWSPDNLRGALIVITYKED
jgi:hypothetical protein